ncbi:MAG: exodeoxyribonuclease VII small subunit [Deltaproteobacteria bacterium]|nr:MAG: exodeoxyribonuclease VII small subunit [Deltaproteobacteria bacterium]
MAEGFEASLSALEERVRKLESAEIPLEEALSLFEEGVELARSCHEQLEAAEQRVAALTRGSSGIEEQALPEPE